MLWCRITLINTKEINLYSKKSFFEINSSKYLEWAVTIIFYAALHLIEMELAKSNQHCKSHDSRNKCIAITTNFKPIRSQYQTLYMQSIKARYEFKKFSSQRVEELKILLGEIEKCLLKVS